MALHTLLKHMLTNTLLPPSSSGDTTLPSCTFPHPNLADLSLQLLTQWSPLAPTCPTQ
ncbi:hypothetical protein K439DRAFT_485426 [Ramaria rubella]|nr:hypothetical protein K439DRAFT_485426 [Ramaria rubella]